jgi:hypothetical protein
MNTANKNKVNISLGKLGQFYQIALIYISVFRESKIFFTNKFSSSSIVHFNNLITMERRVR